MQLIYISPIYIYTKKDVDSALVATATQSTTNTQQMLIQRWLNSLKQSTTYAKTDVDSALAAKSDKLTTGYKIRCFIYKFVEASIMVIG